MKSPETNRIYRGDVLDVLRQWPSAIAHAVVTSPPYWGLRDYGVAGQLGLEKTPDEYIAKMVEIFREVRRVLRDDGTLWLNIGDSYCTNSRNGWQGKNAVPNGERQATPVSNKKGPGLKDKDMVGIPWRVALALRADGWYLRCDIIWSKTNPMPESVTDRPTKSHEYLFLLSKSRRYHYDAEAIKDPVTGTSHDRGEGANPKAIRGVYGWAKDGEHSAITHNISRLKQNESYSSAITGLVTNRNKRSVWTISTQAFAEAHFATYPEKLVEPCVLAGTPESGTVLDPFMGAGTTALVALRAGRRFLGIELNSEYAEMAERRIAPELAQGKLL